MKFVAFQDLIGVQSFLIVVPSLFQWFCFHRCDWYFFNIQGRTFCCSCSVCLETAEELSIELLKTDTYKNIDEILKTKARVLCNVVSVNYARIAKQRLVFHLLLELMN